MNRQGRYNKTINLHHGSYRSPHLKSIKQALADSDQAQRIKWSKQLIFKLNLIHSTHVHSSLNVESLKVDKNDNLIIIDRQIDCVNKSKNLIDLKYIPPENILNKTSQKSKSADIWAAGVCIYFINTNKFPWNKALITDENYKIWTESGKLKDLQDSFCIKVLKIMLSENPDNRLKLKKTLEKVLERPLNFGAVGK